MREEVEGKKDADGKGHGEGEGERRRRRERERAREELNRVVEGKIEDQGRRRIK